MLYFLIQSFPEQAIHVSGLRFVSATGLCNTFFCFCFFDICVYCGHRNETQDLVCVLCDKVLKWMELTTLENCICRDSMPCVDFVEEDQIRLLMTERLYCARHMPQNFLLFIKLSDTASKHSGTLCRPCYMRLMRLKRSKVPSDFTLQAAKEDIDKSSGIWSEFSPLISADQCSVCAHFFNQTKGGRPTKPKLGGKEVQRFQKQFVTLIEVQYLNMTLAQTLL